MKHLLTRGKTLYIMLGVTLIALVCAALASPLSPEYSFEHASYIGVASLLSNTLSRRKLPELKPAAKKAITYLSASLVVAPLYIVALWTLYHFSHGLLTLYGVVTIAVMIFVMPWLVIALRKPAHRTIDRLYYGGRSIYREKLLDVPQKLSDVLNLNELAAGLLHPIPDAVEAPQASLVLPSSGDFISQFSTQMLGVAPPSLIKFRKDSPILKWLIEKNEPLTWEVIQRALEFGGMRETDRNALRTMNIELLVPIKNRGNLVGIIALGKKMPDSSYSSEDIALLAKMGSESAAAVANAQIHAQTQARVHTDELTGLLSHGYFHQRIDEEISRCARFGSIFSVLFMDIDLFKSYNDAFGHLAGDDILKQIAHYIGALVRGIDIPFRYGGDEFAIILPEASLEDAYNVAERIRGRIQSEMDSKGFAVTCSIGVASWPTSGVTREAVIQAADSALYWSKHAGRNRVSVASELTLALGIDHHAGEEEILSAVHALAATVDAKDPNTFGHSKKASEYAALVAGALSYSSDKLATLEAAALLHDIGKIRVPDRVLLKPGPLTDEEIVAIREHPKFGVAILKPIKGLSGCLPIIQHHHERFDGQGYPAGLVGENIPLEARILAVADAYDAMTSPRPYRPNRLSHQQAIDELLRCAGTHFDLEIVKTFAGLWRPMGKPAAISRR